MSTRKSEPYSKWEIRIYAAAIFVVIALFTLGQTLVEHGMWH